MTVPLLPASRSRSRFKPCPPMDRTGDREGGSIGLRSPISRLCGGCHYGLFQDAQYPIDRGPDKHGDRGGVCGVDPLGEEYALDREHPQGWDFVEIHGGENFVKSGTSALLCATPT